MSKVDKVMVGVFVGILVLGFLFLCMGSCDPANIGDYRVVELNDGTFVVERKYSILPGDWIEEAIFYEGTGGAMAACAWIEDKKHQEWSRERRRVVDCFHEVGIPYKIHQGKPEPEPSESSDEVLR